MIATEGHSTISNVANSLRSIANGLVDALVGGINETAYGQVEQTKQNIEDMIALDRLEFFNALGIDPATKQRTEVSVKIDARFAVELSAFEAKQTPEGVEVQVYRYGAPMLYPDAFGPDRPRLGKGIYIRISKRRFPIKKIKQLNLMGEPRVQQEITKMRKSIGDESILAVRTKINDLVEGEGF
jgi:hypothetical protein